MADLSASLRLEKIEKKCRPCKKVYPSTDSRFCTLCGETLEAIEPADILDALLVTLLPYFAKVEQEISLDLLLGKDTVTYKLPRGTLREMLATMAAYQINDTGLRSGGYLSKSINDALPQLLGEMREIAEKQFVGITLYVLHQPANPYGGLNNFTLVTSEEFVEQFGLAIEEIPESDYLLGRVEVGGFKMVRFLPTFADDLLVARSMRNLVRRLGDASFSRFVKLLGISARPQGPAPLDASALTQSSALPGPTTPTPY